MKKLLMLARSAALLSTSALVFAACSGNGQSSLPVTQYPADRPIALARAASISEPLAVDRTSRVATSSVATYKGCNIFAPGDSYNGGVASAAVDSHSANYLSSLTATDNTGFYASTGIEPVNVATSRTSLYKVKQKVTWHSFPVPYPWSSSFAIEPAGDAHAVVLLATPPTCHLYESYSTSFSANVLSAYSGANWDLSQAFKVQASAMASGLSLFAGSVKHEEIATGIHHALNFSVFSHAPCECYTAPASGTDGLAYSGPSTSYEMPYGAHLRLKSSFNDSKFGPQSKAVAEALKNYGMYLADTGGHYTNNNALYFSNPTDGGSWNGSDLSVLGNLKFSDFDVLRVGSISR